MSELDCVAKAGFYPMLLQQYADQAAYDLADSNCRLLSPGVTNLVECLRGNGLDVAVQGPMIAGPYSIEVLRPAWDACRDAYAITDYGNTYAIAAEMPRADCFAENGWLLALAWPRPFGDPSFTAVLDRCQT